MNSNTFLFECECAKCDFRTNIKSNFTAHLKNKKHLNNVNGIKKNFCKICDKQFSQKSIYDRHLLSKCHLDKLNTCVICKDKPIDIINKNNIEMEKNNIEMESIAEELENFEYNNLILFLTIRTDGSNYKLPSHFTDKEDKYDKLYNINEKLYLNNRRWIKSINRFFPIIIKKYLDNWKCNM